MDVGYNKERGTEMIQNTVIKKKNVFLKILRSHQNKNCLTFPGEIETKLYDCQLSTVNDGLV